MPDSVRANQLKVQKPRFFEEIGRAYAQKMKEIRLLVSHSQRFMPKWHGDRQHLRYNHINARLQGLYFVGRNTRDDRDWLDKASLVDGEKFLGFAVVFQGEILPEKDSAATGE